jgi:hypothetical protein
MGRESASVPLESGSERERCTARSKRSGERCGRWPSKGSTVCSTHGGAAPQVKRKARERVEQEAAEKAVRSFGGPVDVDPHTALLQELHRTAGHVAWLGDVVADLEKDKLWGLTGGAAGGIPEAKPSVWVGMYQQERMHLAKVAKLCVDAGIEERRIRLAEDAGRQLAAVIRAIVGRLGVADHPDLPVVLREELGRMTLETGETT